MGQKGDYQLKMALCGYLGSGCTEVAEILASRLELKSVGTAVNTSGILSTMKNSGSLSKSDVDLDVAIKRTAEDLVKGDNIVVEGRSTFMLLKREDVIRIFLNASLEDRIKHVADTRGISIGKAGEDVERSDEERDDLIQRLYKKNYLEAEDFDFLIKTNPEKFLNAAEVIGEAVKSAFQECKFLG